MGSVGEHIGAELERVVGAAEIPLRQVREEESARPALAVVVRLGGDKIAKRKPNHGRVAFVLVVSCQRWRA